MMRVLLADDDADYRLFVSLVWSLPPMELAAACQMLGAAGYLGKDVPAHAIGASLRQVLAVSRAVERTLAANGFTVAAHSSSAATARRAIRDAIEGWCSE